MKKERKEPVFLLEMPHALRHMIMRRGLMLRSSRARTLCCMNKGGPKAWLEAKLIPSAGESADENWDKAHELAGRFKRELHADVYVEPAGEFGRFKELVSPPPPPEMDGPQSLLPHDETSMFSPGAGAGSFLPRGTGGPSFGIGPNSGHVDPFSMGSMGMPGMPHIPDPMKDILPPRVRQMMGMGSPSPKIPGTESRPTLSFPPLNLLSGWSELPESKQKMFEVEAAQLNLGANFGLPAEMAGFAEPHTERAFGNSEKALAAISVHPKASATLKRFLLESFERMTDGSGRAD